jgi:hypothetical protein
MSDRALLEELINFIDSKSPKWEQQKDTDSIIQIKHKAKEIRTRMAASNQCMYLQLMCAEWAAKCNYSDPKHMCGCYEEKKDGN